MTKVVYSVWLVHLPRGFLNEISENHVGGAEF